MGSQEARRVWETALGQLQLRVSRTNFETWLKGTVGLSSTNGQFVVGTNSDFTSEWLDTRLRPLIAKTLGAILRAPVEVRFQLAGSNGNGATASPLFSGNADAEAFAPTKVPQVNTNFTFERYVVGDFNRLAAAGCLASSLQPGQLYTPLLIHGQHGLGKTHLLHAVAHQAAALGRSAFYTSGENFTNEFVQAVSRGRAADFQSRHRGAEIFLVDDIHFLAGKKQTQEAFLYIFNELHARGCQITMASDRAPSDIATLAAPLRSRLVWGLVAELQPPDHQSRCLIISNKALDQGIDLPDEVVDLIASHAVDNPRELEGCLNRVLALTRLNRTPLTRETVAQALPPRPTNTLPCPPQAVLATVAEYFSINTQSMIGRNATRAFTAARQMAVYLLREDAKLSLKEIGAVLGGRSHSTISHSYQKVSSSLASDLSLRKQLADIRIRLATD